MCGIFYSGLLIISVAAWYGSQGHENYIELRPQKGKIIPKEYFILSVTDSRSLKNSIGTFISLNPLDPQKSAHQPLYLRGGAQASFGLFLSQSVSKRSDLRPVVFNIKKFNVSEHLQPNGMITGKVEARILFERNRNGELIELVEFNGGSNYIRSAKNLKSIEPALSNTILNAIKYFDKWINVEVSTNEMLAEKINLKISDYYSDMEKDTLFYSPTKKLKWTDFRSAPDYSSGFDAEIFPFFSFEQASEMNDGTIDVQLILKTYLVRNFSWVKGHARTPYTLNHEQRHFDILKIIAENFKSKIRSENLTVDNYQGILSVEYLESLREMNKMQVQYDAETRHGTDAVNQENWNRKIDKELNTTSNTTRINAPDYR